MNSEIYLQEKLFSDRYRDILSFFHLDDMMDYLFPLDDSNIPFCLLTNDTLAVYSHLYYNTYRKDINKI